MIIIPNMSNEVTQFLKQLNHPFINEINALRNTILSVNNGLTENIKWNGPNYCIYGNDIITMRVQPLSKQVQMIFHRGAKKLEQPAAKLIANKSKLLVWKENDRAVLTFKSMHEIETNKAELEAIIIEWIDAIK